MTATIMDTIQYLRDWLEECVASQLVFKVPPKDRQPMEANYDYQTAHPSVFSFVMPTEDKLPPNMDHSFPCIVIQPLSGTDEPLTNDRTIQFRIWITTWDPGLHGSDIFIPSKESGEWLHWTGDDAKAFYQRNADGWQDAWNALEVLLRELETAEVIHRIRLCKEQSITWGPLNEVDGSLIDAYPFHYVHVDFSVQVPLIRKPSPAYDGFFNQ